MRTCSTCGQPYTRRVCERCYKAFSICLCNWPQRICNGCLERAQMQEIERTIRDLRKEFERP